jgi:urease accessory protein
VTAIPSRPTPARCGSTAAAIAIFWAFCPRAEAHLVTTGLGPAYDGIAHFALSPADMAVVVVLTLLAAMRGARTARRLLIILPGAWLLGALPGLKFPIGANLGWATGISIFLAGALVAADYKLPDSVLMSLVGAIAAWHGMVTASDLAGSSTPGLELTGMLIALMIVSTLVAGLVVSLKAFWARIVVRVMGSWIAATGLLMIGWTFSAKQ